MPVRPIRIMLAVFFLLSMAATCFALDGVVCNIPHDKSIPTQRDFNKKKYKWLTRVGVNEYDRSGVKNPKWDTPAKKFLPEFAKYYCDLPDAPDLKSLLKQAENLRKLGCEDPFVVFAVGAVYGKDHQYRKAFSIINRVYSLYKRAKYKYWLKVLYSKENANVCGAGGFNSANNWKRNVCVYGATSAVDGSFTSAEIPILYRTINLLYFKSGWEHAASFRSGTTPDPWYREMVQGRNERNIAWQKRGGGWASTVTEEGWKGFREHLQKARDHFVRAWELHKDRPEAATQMIVVTTGGQGVTGVSKRDWLVRALSAQLDYDFAYDAYIWGSRPRWGGSHKLMHKFGLECLASERFDTNMPLAYLGVVRSISTDLRDYRLAFHRDDVKKNLAVLFDGLFKDVNEKGDVKRKEMLNAQYAEVCCLSGQYEKAGELLKQVGERFDFASPAWLTYPVAYMSRTRKIIETEVILFTGECKDDLEKIEHLCLWDKFDEARPIFEKVIPCYKNNRFAQSYLFTKAVRAWINPSEYPYSTPVLNIAIIKKRTDVVEWMLKNGADANGGDNSGYRAIHCAAAMGDKDIVELLIKYGADVNKKTKSGNTALSLARKRDRKGLIPILIAAGSKPDNFKRKKSKGKQSSDKTAELCAAIKRCNKAQVELLIKNGVDLNAAKYGRKPPVYRACEVSRSDIAEVLLENGADPDLPGPGKWYPVHYAACKGNLQLLGLLIKYKADINAKNGGKSTALTLAVANGKLNCVQLLIENKCGIDLFDVCGRTALYRASEKNNSELVNLLLKAGANTQIAEKKNNLTPLHQAAVNGNLDMVKSLLLHGANANAMTIDKNLTPLDLAKEKGHLEVVRLLSDPKYNPSSATKAKDEVF